MQVAGCKRNDGRLGDKRQVLRDARPIVTDSANSPRFQSNIVGVPPYRTRFEQFHPLRSIIVMVLVLLAGCTRSPQVVKIGLVAPFEGQNREMGYDGIYAARLAVREFNANQAQTGVWLALVALDDSSEVDIAAGNGQSLATDPSIIAVVGMGDDQTRLATTKSLTQSNIPFVHTGVLPFEPTDPASYPAEFRQAYAKVTPFDEEAGELAGSVYDAFQLIIYGIEILEQEKKGITAETMAEFLNSAKIKGITGKEIFLAQCNTQDANTADC